MNKNRVISDFDSIDVAEIDHSESGHQLRETGNLAGLEDFPCENNFVIIRIHGTIPLTADLGLCDNR